jgi:hypothetical protein
LRPQRRRDKRCGSFATEKVVHPSRPHHNIISSDAKNTKIRSRIPTKLENRGQKEFPRERQREKAKGQKPKRTTEGLPTRSRRNPIRSAGKDQTRSCCNNRASSEPSGKAGRDHKNAATNVMKQRDQTLIQHQTKLGIGILSRFVNLLRFLFRNEAPRMRAGMRFQKGPALPVTAYERDYELPATTSHLDTVCPGSFKNLPKHSFKKPQGHQLVSCVFYREKDISYNYFKSYPASYLSVA